MPDGIRFVGNLYTGHQSGYNVPESDLAIIVVLRHSATGYGYNNTFWSKHGAELASKAATPPAGNPYDSGDRVQLSTLAKRGVQFMVCGTASRGLSRRLAGEKGDADATFKEMEANLISSARIVPAGVVGVTHAQEYGFSYLYRRIANRKSKRKERNEKPWCSSSSPRASRFSLFSLGSSLLLSTFPGGPHVGETSWRSSRIRRRDAGGCVRRVVGSDAAGIRRAGWGQRRRGSRKCPGKSRCFFDCPQHMNGFGLVHILNYLTAYPAGQAGVASSFYGVGPASSIAMGFNDAMWAKYGLGEILGLKDASGKPYTRNVFFSPTKADGHLLAQRTQIPTSIAMLGDALVGSSIPSLQKMGTKFILCNNALGPVDAGARSPRQGHRRRPRQGTARRISCPASPSCRRWSRRSSRPRQQA